MAKAGLPLPAEAPARLPAFSAVLADIGDEQSLTANLSTFSGHLRRIQVRCGVLRCAFHGVAMGGAALCGAGGAWCCAVRRVHSALRYAVRGRLLANTICGVGY